MLFVAIGFAAVAALYTVVFGLGLTLPPRLNWFLSIGASLAAAHTLEGADWWLDGAAAAGVSLLLGRLVEYLGPVRAQPLLRKARNPRRDPVGGRVPNLP